MKWILMFTIGAIAACAIAIGDHSNAKIESYSDIKRELGASAPAFEDVFIQEKK